MSETKSPSVPPAQGTRLNADAPAWTPSFGGGQGASGLADLALPGTNHHESGAYPADDDYPANASDDPGMDDIYEDEFETDHAEYEHGGDNDWHQQQQWMNMMQQQQQQPYNFSNAAPQSGAAPFPNGPPPPLPAHFFPGGKVPQTPEEWETFNTELREMQKKQIEKQIEERKAREEAKKGQHVKKGNYENAPLTINGKHRWPKNTAAKKAETAQKAAFESFANALLHAVSPFMAPLRRLTKTSLPHIKVDQRFGRRGQPETAVMQFIVAPVVVNYKPAHFHEVSPGDLLEFHYDFAQVLSQLRSANSIAISYGPAWKPFQLPYCFVGCREYAKEVRHLCPEEVPNGRSEAVYEDDVVKDITAVICAVQELEALTKMSFIDAMKGRVNLVALYDVFSSLFEGIGDYQIQIRNINAVPSQYLLKTSLQVLQKTCPLAQGHAADGDAPLTAQSFEVSIGGDITVWDDLPTVQNTFQSGKTVVVSVDHAEERKAPVGLSISKSVDALPRPDDRSSLAAPTVAPVNSNATTRCMAPSGNRKSGKPVRVSPGAAVAVVVACVAATAVTAGLVLNRSKK